MISSLSLNKTTITIVAVLKHKFISFIVLSIMNFQTNKTTIPLKIFLFQISDQLHELLCRSLSLYVLWHWSKDLLVQLFLINIHIVLSLFYLFLILFIWHFFRCPLKASNKIKYSIDLFLLKFWARMIANRVVYRFARLTETFAFILQFLSLNAIFVIRSANLAHN